MDQEFSFGHWIRKRRNALGLTQKVLAEQVGYSSAMIRKIENDERRPSKRGAVLLAKALQIPEDQQDAFLKVANQVRPVYRLDSVDPEPPFSWLAPSRIQTNLPLSATLFVGREGELASIIGLLRDPVYRLITLFGLAGIGKTRLALKVARNQLDQFAHGVFFVSLTSLTSPEMIVTTIANVIGFKLHGANEPREQLLRYLQAKQMLLVLDNFEHLMEGVDLLSKILQTAPGIRLLVTSRERLNLQGEWIFEVEGLAYPAAIGECSLQGADRYAAVQLFLQSALRIDPGFNLDENNWEWVVRICQLTEGIPLGIELAAAWIRVFSCQEIFLEIEKNLDFLKATVRDIPERHRNMRAALDHSWKLLSRQEKKAFQRLSVFRGGFRRKAAAEVAGASLETIASLLDKSLVKRVGEDRYDLHELVRQYAAEHLQVEAQEQSLTHGRFSSYYAALLGHWERKIRSPRQMEILAEMDIEMDNLRLAWRWMVTHHQITNIKMSLHSMWHFHEIRARFRDGEALFGEAVAALRTTDQMKTDEEVRRSVVLGQVLAGQGYFSAHLDQYEKANELLQQSLALLRSSPDRAALAQTLAYFAYMKYRKGEFEQAHRYAEESLTLNQTLGNQTGIVFCLITLSYIFLAEGADEQAQTLSSEGLIICRDTLGDPHGTADCLITLIAAVRRLGQFSQAKRWAMESLQISKSLNDHWGMAQTLRQLGLIGLDLGELGYAETSIRQSISLSRKIGDRALLVTALIDLGVVTSLSGRGSESKPFLLEALQTAIENKTIVQALEALVEIARIEMKEGETEKALELVVHSLKHQSIHQEIIDRAEQLRAELVSCLTPEQIETVQARAQAKTLESLTQEILAASW